MVAGRATVSMNGDLKTFGVNESTFVPVGTCSCQREAQNLHGEGIPLALRIACGSNPVAMLVGAQSGLLEQGEPRICLTVK